MNNQLYANQKGIVHSLQEWKNVVGKQAAFTFRLGSLDKVIVSEETPCNGVKTKEVLTKVKGN